MLFSQNIYAMNTQPVPSKNPLLIKTATKEQTIKDIPAYFYNNSNYFMLRDIGEILGYKVVWNGDTKEIFMENDPIRQDIGGMSKIKDAENVTEVYQTITIGNITYPNIKCLNIDGHNYFKLRDLSVVMEFTCEWNSENNTIIISDKENPEKNTIVAGDRGNSEKNTVVISDNANDSLSTERVDKRFEIFLDDDLNQIVLENDDVKYIKNSKDIGDIEKYLRKHVDDSFKASDFSIAESDIYGNGIVTLDLRFKVGDTDQSNFGYRMICIDNTVKIVNLIGERNSDFNINTVIESTLTESEARQKAIELDGFKHEVERQIVTKHFDMNTLKFIYEVDTLYITDRGQYFGTLHSF